MRSPLRHHYARHIDRKISVAKLIEVKHVGTQLANERNEKCRRFGKVVLGLLHPLQTEAGRAVVQAVKMIHP